MITCPECAAVNPDDISNCFNCGKSLQITKPAKHEYALRVGTLLSNGRYSIGKILGQGGFGITYLCIDMVNKKTVAIKELFPSGCYREGVTVQLTGSISPDDFRTIRTKFIDEGKRLTEFHHESIVKVYSTFEENNTGYIVMNYIEGLNLRQIVERNGLLSEADAIRYIKQIASALEYVHSKGFLHRDIKPDNIILSDNKVILIDFGSARQFAGSVTKSLTVILTPGFAPIEQYGKRHQSAPTDIYALGATLYYLLTGKVPAPSTDRSIEDTLIPPDRINPAVSQQTSSAIMLAMQVKDVNRPQTIRDFINSFTIHTQTIRVEEPRESRKPNANHVTLYMIKFNWKDYIPGIAFILLIVSMMIFTVIFAKSCVS